ncbi:MAG: hypothetical protein UH824_07775 [Acutalibacteraceae bacterium]|nr:hypothetical protein [Acutalibacteraceae bacterium]
MSDDEWLHETVKTASIETLIAFLALGIAYIAFRRLYKKWLHNGNMPKNRFFAKIKELLIDKDGISTGDGTGIALYILVIGLCVYGAFFYYGG